MNSEHNKNYLVGLREHIYNDTSDPNISFADFIRLKRKELNKKLDGQLDGAITVRNLAERIGIKYEMFRKILNMQKQTKKRDCIITICALLYLDANDTNIALRLYNMNPLNESDYRDCQLIEILNANYQHPDNDLITVDDINESLELRRTSSLDVNDYRQKKQGDNKIYPYTLVKKRVECCTDELLYGDMYDSLETAYYRMCYTSAFMWLDDNGKHKYKLYAGLRENCPSFGYTKDGREIKSFVNIDDTGEFKDCFDELLKMARIEQRKYAAFLNDTRNYQERISARVINNELHIFYETYNYKVPELGEYYLMDYVNSVYTLYVSRSSRFMMYYLSPNDYRELFGKISDKPEEKYSSIDAIEKAVELAHMDRKEIIHLRIKEFNNAKAKVDSLAERLKAGSAHIRNYDMIFDAIYDVIEYYKVTDEFQCTYDEECGKIYNIGVDKAVVDLKDGGQVELSFDNLCDGFRLGLNSTDEIYYFLSKHGSLKITDIIKNGTI